MMAAASQASASQYAQARQYFERGELKPAVALCQEILQEDESFSPAYALMGELWQQLGNFESATNFLALAQKFDSTNPFYLVRQAQCLGAMERWEEAAQALSRALILDPYNPTTLMLLGDVQLNRAHFAEAMQYYAQAKKLTNSPEIDEHIANAHIIQGQPAAAEAILIQLTARHPQTLRAWTLLGDLNREKPDLEEAERCFDQALRCNPASYEALLGKGIVLLDRDHLEAGLDMLDKAIQANPQHYRAYYVLGDFFLRRMQFGESEKFLRRAVELNPHFLDARRKLAVDLCNLQKKEEALEQLNIILEKEPDNQNLLFLRAVQLGERPDTAPRAHVANLFDVYADKFEAHLTKKLGYRTPQILAERIIHLRTQEGIPSSNLSLLDIGCGTGLVAEAFQSFTQYRVGIDVSPRMVEEANKRGLYDEALVEDGVEYMLQTARHFDLIIAADVLVYIGNPEPLFAAAVDKLTPGGYLAFSVEKGDDAPPFVLRPSGRFAHDLHATKALGEKYGLKLALCELAALRQERDVPLEGYIFIFQR